MRALFASACALLSALGAAGATLPLPRGTDRAEREITARVLEGAIRFLSDDLLEGRAPASRGDRLARLYVESEFRALGLRPGGPGGSFAQPFEMVGVTSRPPAEWRFDGPRGSLALRFGEQFIATNGRQDPQASLEAAEVVFVGYGIEAPEFRWDDFKGEDVAGKVLLVLNNDPDWDPSLFAGVRRLYYGRWDYKYQTAASRGAAGAIIVHTTPSAGYPWQVVRSSWTGEQFELPSSGEPRLAVQGWVTEEAAARLAALGGHDLSRLVASARSRDFRPVGLGVETSISIPAALRRVETANVLGLLPGRDPRLSREAVIFTAHHDHLGVGEPDATGDRIYNGARDNAAGVAQLLAVARAFAALPEPPRRSVLFISVAAEEQGLLGSAYYAAHPTFPAGRIAAVVNFDGGNIWGRTRDLALVGRGKSSLDAVAEAAAVRQGRRIVEEAFPDRGHYYRSDQFSFAKIGVPGLYFDEGTEVIGKPHGWGREQQDAWVEAHYHRPSDEISPEWDLEGMVEDARVAFIAGLALAEADAMPAWTPGDEFEAVRRKALEEAAALSR